MNAPDLYAGAGRASITPPLGIKTVGFSSREGVVERIESELTSTAIVFAAGGSKMAIVAVDLAIAPVAVVMDWRRRVAEAIRSTPANVMINLSHTHSGPPLPGVPPEFAFQSEMIDRYYAVLVQRIVDSALAANASLQPARIAHGEGSSHIGINRREMGADGYVFLGEDPNKPIDPVVGVVRVDDLEGRPIATLFSYGCHTVVVGPNSRVASPDFPGASRDAIERAMGGLSLYLQGGGGDIMPVGGMGWEEDCRDSKDRLGLALAGEVIKVAAGLRTNARQGERTWLPSLLGPGMTLTPWIPVEGHAVEHFEATSETISLDLIPFPSLEEAHRLRAERQRDLEEAEASGQERRVIIGNRFLAWSNRLVQAVADQEAPTADFEVQALRIGDVAFVSLSAEVFSQTTVELRKRSPFEHTMALGYSNGVLSYLPRAEDYPVGGWRVDDRYRIPDLVFQAYLLPTGLRPDSEQRAVDAAVGLLDRLREPAAAATGGR
ncbi:MAG: neutral/alkaline non-lysosomal ceramidase N-terminal domain-containing protein [Chloroflexi bacterium]|nr:neutral/alkaline non-lysosomal ceramidase N-terminal domain-containing protein [Chloroflexota bacterium]MBV9600277.1 neutral/alkaline non-lysosomal ceramidase N-terminal domain-containing protein [Chloroflexota bacterium]